MKIDKTIGLIAAPPNKFGAGGDVEIDVIRPLAEKLHRDGVAGVFVNGTTGQGMSMTVEQRRRTAEEWRRVLPQSMKLFVHVGYAGPDDARTMAGHAAEIGADAVASLLPDTLESGDVGAAGDWCKDVAAAAPALPFYLYYMPSMNGVEFRVARFLEHAGPDIPNLAGAKYTCETMADYFEASRLDGGRYDLLWGRDEMLLGALAMGAKGGVGSTYNTDSPLYLELIEAFDRGDLDTARDLQAKAVAIINKLAGTGDFRSALKARLRDQGITL